MGGERDGKHRIQLGPLKQKKIREEKKRKLNEKVPLPLNLSGAEV